MKRNIIRRAWKCITVVTAYLYIPMMITLVFSGNGADVLIETGADVSSGRRINVIYENAVQMVGLDDFVSMAVAGEIINSNAYEIINSKDKTDSGGVKLSDTDDVVRALAVLVRSDVVRQMGKRDEIDSDMLENTFCTKSEMKKVWGDDWKDVYDEIKGLVKETEGQILKFNGAAVKGMYTRVSSGKTMSGSALLGEGYEYLTQIECEKDKEAANFSNTTDFDNAAILSLVRDWEKKNGQDSGIDTNNPSGDIQITAKTDDGYITGIQLGDLCMSGEKFAAIFGLNSPFLTFEYRSGSVRITSKGVGLGFGMSIYTANLMASDGSSYQDILKHFYPTCEIGE